MSTPTVRRLQLGKELARLRTRANVRVDVAAKAIEKTAPVISRLEHGETGLRRLELRALLEFYSERIEDGEPVDIEWFLKFNMGAENRGRWGDYRSVYAKWFRMAVDLEEDASEIDAYHMEVVFGLLQTEDYMRALFTGAQARKADKHSDDVISARLERQQVLTKIDAPRVTVVLSESSLLRFVGTSKIMRGQLLHLADLAELPNVAIHILPFRCATAPIVEGPFMRLRIPALDQNAPALEFVFVESYTNGEYLDSNDALAAYNALWSGLLGSALDPVASRDFLLRVSKTYQ